MNPYSMPLPRETLARWMMERGYATGHGDSIEDLLAELDWQIKEQIARLDQNREIKS